ncbi:inositol phosphorylceramide synthase, partial [Ascoidea rubescens DSM 1968]
MMNPVKLFNYYFLSEKPPGSTISDLNLNFNPKTTFSNLKNYKFKFNDFLHFTFLSIVLVFSFFVLPVNFFLKFCFFFLVCCLFFLPPILNQFFLPALPVLTWVFLFFICGKIPNQYRPPISVKILPSIETIFYGDNLSDVLASKTYKVLDLLAWLPYGILHFSIPFVIAALVFIFGPPTAVNSFAFAFGYMNLFGVLIQILFPAAPPWYKLINGLNPANYSMNGNPGGLQRIDQILGIDMYTSTFTNAPVPFGAFPSLHSGCATMNALFLSYIFPRFKPLWLSYLCWLWWSTMYLTHHYFVDLMAGSVLSYVIFTYTKYKMLPTIDNSCFCRWSYTELNYINISHSDPLSIN